MCLENGASPIHTWPDTRTKVSSVHHYAAHAAAKRIPPRSQCFSSGSFCSAYFRHAAELAVHEGRFYFGMSFLSGHDPTLVGHLREIRTVITALMAPTAIPLHFGGAVGKALVCFPIVCDC